MNNRDYRNYSVEEYARDESFRQWVLDRNPQSEILWLAWLAENPDCNDKVQLAKVFLLNLEHKQVSLPTSELDQIVNNIIHAGRPTTISRWRKLSSWHSWQAAAVVLLLVIGFAAVVKWVKSNTFEQSNLEELSPILVKDYTEIIHTGSGTRKILLQDSSLVVLYPHAKLKYPNRFNPNRREVYLSGQAFFSVTKNPKKPFWVYTDHISTQVLGTSFLVNTEGSQAKVEVRSGRVSVYIRKKIQAGQPVRRNELDGMVLIPNQQVIFSEKEHRLVKSVVEQPIALHKGQRNDYVFEEAPIAAVFAVLEHTYGLAFIYDESILSSCYLTANLTGESLFDQLNVICRITRSSYELVDGQIIIHSEGCMAK